MLRIPSCPTSRPLPPQHTTPMLCCPASGSAITRGRRAADPAPPAAGKRGGGAATQRRGSTCWGGIAHQAKHWLASWPVLRAQHPGSHEVSMSAMARQGQQCKHSECKPTIQTRRLATLTSTWPGCLTAYLAVLLPDGALKLHQPLPAPLLATLARGAAAGSSAWAACAATAAAAAVSSAGGRHLDGIHRAVAAGAGPSALGRQLLCCATVSAAARTPGAVGGLDGGSSSRLCRVGVGFIAGGGVGGGAGGGNNALGARARRARAAGRARDAGCQVRALFGDALQLPQHALQG